MGVTQLQIYLFLGVAIIAEVIGTTALAASQNFTRLGPSLIAVAGYCTAFYLISFPLKVLPTGVVYAIWSGLGIVLITTVAWAWRGQTLDVAALVGIGLILAGVLVINLFSKAVVR